MNTPPIANDLPSKSIADLPLDGKSGANFTDTFFDPNLNPLAANPAHDMAGVQTVVPPGDLNEENAAENTVLPLKDEQSNVENELLVSPSKPEGDVAMSTEDKSSPDSDRPSGSPEIKLKIKRTFLRGREKLTSSLLSDGSSPEEAGPSKKRKKKLLEQGEHNNEDQTQDVICKQSPPGKKGKRGRKKKVVDLSPIAVEHPSSAVALTTPDVGTPLLPAAGHPKGALNLQALEERMPPKWLVGDLVWGKVSGHPWWPCMVAYDPVEGVYTKFKGGAIRASRLYHLQFFGDVAERGWVGERSTVKFEGKDQYEQVLEDSIKHITNTTQRNQARKKSAVKQSRKAAWEVALQAAEEALPLSLLERKQQYTFKYDTAPSETAEEDTAPPATTPAGGKKRGRKRKSAVAAAGAASLQSDDTDNEEEHLVKKKRKVVKKTPTQSQPEESKKRNKSQKKEVERARFELFCQKQREQVMVDHPDYAPEQVQEELQMQWNILPDKLKAKYTSKFTSTSQNSASDSDMDQPGGKRKLEMTSGSPTKQEKKVPPKGQPSSPKKRNTAGKSSEADLKSSVDQCINSILALSQSDSAESSYPSTPGQVDSPAAPFESLPMKKRIQRRAEEGGKPAREKKIKKGRKPKKDKGQDVGPNSVASEKEEGAQNTDVEELSSQVSDHESEESSAPSSSSGLGRGAWAASKENLCQVCEQVGELLLCEGSCCGAFHLDCIGLQQMPTGTFKCDECISGVHTCFVCRKSEATTKRCSIPICGKYYHEDCLRKFPNAVFEAKGFRCPLHVCGTCVAVAGGDIKKIKSRGRILARCVRCPTAYHVNDSCIAAGCIQLAQNNIVCSNHFQPVKNQAHHSHVNVSWCFICSKGGDLLCCEMCPAAFHPACLGLEDLPEGTWFCRDCSLGKKPLYKEIVWVKLGTYRWWPAEIEHPSKIPQNIYNMPHQVGEFPVRFFGSNDYFWTHQARVFAFQEGDKGSKESATSKGIAKVFKKGVVEATVRFKYLQTQREQKEAQETRCTDLVMLPGEGMETNRPVGSVQIYTADPSEIQRCECKLTDENPCGPESDCLNRNLMIECHPAGCPVGEKCQNQRFVKRQYPQVESFKTPDGRGWGLKTLVDIKKHDFVYEYIGELIDEEEVQRRIKKAHEDNVTNFYMLTLDKNRIIDAGPKANMSRFMNHSCQPNCETQKWMVNGDIRVGLFAMDDIPTGSELTFNYNLDCLGNEKTPCNCGAPICSGYIGVRPKRKRKVAPKNVKKEHEDECFRCSEGGELVMCDRKTCPKAYHVTCLNLTKPPHGKWECPWHHCDVCGKLATVLCDVCPNSFCKEHATDDNISKHQSGKMICHEHTAEEVQESLQALEEKQKKALTVKAESEDDDSVDSAPQKQQNSQPKKKSQDKLPTEEGTVKKPRRKPKQKVQNGTSGKGANHSRNRLKGEANSAGEPEQMVKQEAAEVPKVQDDDLDDFEGELMIDFCSRLAQTCPSPFITCDLTATFELGLLSCHSNNNPRHRPGDHSDVHHMVQHKDRQKTVFRNKPRAISHDAVYMNRTRSVTLPRSYGTDESESPCHRNFKHETNSVS
ncbi:Histone-lysine N-methyltransferase, H3 lysine-36 and H4 lysine-20 specific [Branchiostoma belcheri]|nr:Histone-lysine N-methyltransferase, H3 lysine-36 and H4 lysine-20 specific [Branchiostoma belcheri]